MNSLDFAPVYRSTVGFDRLAHLANAAHKASVASNQPAYPPYNIEKSDEDAYRITMAVAGFSETDIDVTVTGNNLVITGKVKQAREDKTTVFLYRGIASRSFERRFELADHIIVNGASLDNGLLSIDLIRQIPEEKKPRTITIGRPGPAPAGKAV